MSSAYCTSVTPECPVEATTYGYYPALGTNSTLLAVFAILLVSQLVMGYLTKVYAYSLTIAAGCLLETLGYAGRLIMNKNPWNQTGLRMQIVCLIIGPSFIAAGIYLTLKHFIRLNGPEFSRLKPQWYTWIFIGCDIGSILLQAAGGGLAGAAGDDMDMMDIGNNIIIAGIAFQVATMATCGILTADYSIRRYHHRKTHPEATKTTGGSSKKAMIFQASVVFAYVTVLIRCIYRIPEMVGGWGNEMMRNQTEFMILDGLMIALACASLTIFHPGYFYPYMRTGHVELSEASEMELASPSSMSTERVNAHQPTRID